MFAEVLPRGDPQAPRPARGRLPPKAPAVHESDWVVLGIEYVDSPARARRLHKDLAATLGRLETVAEQLTPAPEGMEPDLLPTSSARWCPPGTTCGKCPDLPHLRTPPRWPPASARPPSATRWSTPMSGRQRAGRPQRSGLDLRLELAGPRAAWLDTVFFLIGPRGDGLDVDMVLAERALTRDYRHRAPSTSCWQPAGRLLLQQQDEPVPPASPFLASTRPGRARSVLVVAGRAPRLVLTPRVTRGRSPRRARLRVRSCSRTITTSPQASARRRSRCRAPSCRP